MNSSDAYVVFGKIPNSVRGAATAHGLTDRECLFSAKADLTLDGSVRETWLIVTATSAIAIGSEFQVPAPEPGAEAVVRGGGVTGPFPLKDVDRFRVFHTVGSAFLQFRIGGLYVDVVCFSNSLVDVFDRVRAQLERLHQGRELQPEALTKPRELICPTCGLPLPGRKAQCPKCQGGHGAFFRALRLMIPYRAFLALLLVAMLMRVALSLLPPYLTKILVNNVIIAKTHVEWLKWIVLALVGAAAGQMVLNVFIGLANAKVGNRITRDLRDMLQDKLVGLGVDYYDQNPTGALVSRVLWDVDYFGSFVDQVAQGFLMNVMTVIGIGVVLFTENWQLALWVMLPIPLVLIGTPIFWKYVYPRYFPVWDSQSKASQLLSGILSGIRLVKSFGQENRERKRFQGSSAYMQQARVGLAYSFAVFNPVMGFIFGLGGLIIWLVGGMMVVKAELDMGTLMLFFGYVAMFYGPISSLTSFSNWLTGFVAAGHRVFELLDSTTTLQEDPHPVRMPELGGAIEFRNVTFGYDPHHPVLKNVSFKVNPGQFLGVVGKSGCGKTTIVNLICRFYDVQEGEVLIDDVDVRKIAREDLHNHVGLVLQEPFLFRAAVRDNIAYGQPDAVPRQVIEAAKAANAHDFIARMPGAYDRKLGERGAGLSGGERQRVTLARALIREPKILILDEATSSVDTESEQEIQTALALLRKGRTSVVVAHRLSTLKNADYILVVDDGAIVESGSHEELMQLKKLYYKLVRIQTELTRLELD